MPQGKFAEVAGRLDKLEKEHGRDVAVAKLAELAFEDALNVIKFKRPGVRNYDGTTNFYGDLPFFVNKTDQERCQKLPYVFDR